MSTYLITGVNRGIGLALLKQTASVPDNLVIGTVRSIEKAQEINDLGYKNVKVITANFSGSLEEIKEVFKGLEALTPKGIDVVIHNAGVTSTHPLSKTEEHPISEYQRVFEVNVLGTAKFYQSIYQRLENNGKPVKVIFISSVAGIISNMVFPCNSYGISKAAVNYFARQVSIERKEKGDIVIPIHPGTVETDMMVEYKDQFDLISPKDSASAILKVIDSVTKKDNGKFLNYDGTEFQY